MQTQQLAGKLVRRHNVVSLVVKASIVAVCGLLLVGATLMVDTVEGHAQGSVCSSSGRMLISANRTTCVSRQGMRGSIASSRALKANTPGRSYRTAKRKTVGSSNVFPQGQCTWWADQRYYQLHGVFVPWVANAGQWAARARTFGWHVSKLPHVGDILALKSGVQGAGRLGHVGVVEQVLGNGHVIVSSMNWGAQPAAVTSFQFAPGRGVAFIHI
ncbi:MAG: CHAP domain-containing protein [Chloroflexi bacterium]|nr:CHAP domain-containing protein [Chloroflexota bacterium]